MIIVVRVRYDQKCFYNLYNTVIFGLVSHLRKKSSFFRRIEHFCGYNYNHKPGFRLFPN